MTDLLHGTDVLILAHLHGPIVQTGMTQAAFRELLFTVSKFAKTALKVLDEPVHFLRLSCYLEVVYDLGGCQNYGPFLGTLNIRCRTISRTQKGTIILTTTHLASISTRRPSRNLTSSPMSYKVGARCWDLECNIGP